MRLRILKIATFAALPSRRSWGECWWTARDICLTNTPEFPDPLQAIADAHSASLSRAILFGDPA